MNTSGLNETQPTYHIMKPRRDVLPAQINDIPFQIPLDLSTTTTLQSRLIPATNEIQRSPLEVSVGIH